MKIFTKVLLISIILLLSLSLKSQNVSNEFSGLPLSPHRSVLFGSDIVIDANSLRDQRNLTICSAFNGWLYAVYTWNDPAANNMMNITLLRSKDNGETWTILLEGPETTHSIVSRYSFVACGNNENNIKLFLGALYEDTITHHKTGGVSRLDGITGAVEDEILHDTSFGYEDLVIACDNNIPAANSNPFSLAVFYSKIAIVDSLILRTSSNGGMSFDNRKVVALSDKVIRNVGLQYGICPSKNAGRYFMAWNERTYTDTTYGHLYAAHTEPYFNSPVTTPVNIDSTDVTGISRCMYPVVSCQFNQSDNDSSDLTEVILYAKYLPSVHRFDMAGCYNKKAITGTHFQKIDFTTPGIYKTHPDICFNSPGNNFMITYFDSINKKLPIIENNYNLIAPQVWNTFSLGYNDNGNITKPFPSIRNAFGQNTIITGWIAESDIGKGIAMMDAPFVYYTGINGNDSKTLNEKQINVYPNPCGESFTLDFVSDQNEYITIELYNILGQPVKTLTNRRVDSNKQSLKINCSDLSPGTYYISISAGKSVCWKKIIILH